MPEYLLEVKNLKTYFPVYGGIFRHQVGKVYAVDDLSLKVKPGETIGLVGESGCGKTTVGRSIIGLYKPYSGKILYNGQQVSDFKRKKLKEYRKNVQMIFQDPFESLNSRHTIGNILEEPFVIHNIGTQEKRSLEVISLLQRVGIGKSAVNRFPHEFSGGQRQRICIARAIALKPKMIICDEPVSALDVSIQAQIINLLMDLQREMGLAYLFIAHDLAVVKHVSDYIAVMYLGKIVEFADADHIYENSLHPYTRALFSAIPSGYPDIKNKKQLLTGDVPSPINPPSGCSFHNRCPVMKDKCIKIQPDLRLMATKEGKKHLVACHFV